MSYLKSEIFRLTVAVFNVSHIERGIVTLIYLNEVQIGSNNGRVGWIRRIGWVRGIRWIGRCYSRNSHKLVIGNRYVVLTVYPPRHIGNQLLPVILVSEGRIKIDGDTEQIFRRGLCLSTQRKFKR